MVRKVEDLRKMSTKEYKKLTDMFFKKLDKYIENDISNQYIAKYLYLAYQNDYLWEEDLKRIISSSIEGIELTIEETYNINKVKKILEEQYKLKIINEKPLKIEKL